MEHLAVGDPLADAAVESLADLNEDTSQSFVRAGMDNEEQTLSRAPQPLIDFFKAVEPVPAWFDSQQVYAGCRGFHANSDVLALTFVVGSGVQGFSTVIAKSFFATGRMTDFGIRRTQQNLRHLMEILMPHALDRDGDGRKLTLRIRLIHAQVRKQLREWDGWDETADGVPINASHVVLATAISPPSALSSENGSAFAWTTNNAIVS
ncbi:MAG: hypothetical protein OXG98_17510 [Gemmatimonadetes bacterium]|nr:hypothetical protein [Gemmatimonadota bacterium]